MLMRRCQKKPPSLPLLAHQTGDTLGVPLRATTESIPDARADLHFFLTKMSFFSAIFRNPYHAGRLYLRWRPAKRLAFLSPPPLGPCRWGRCFCRAIACLLFC